MFKASLSRDDSEPKLGSRVWSSYWLLLSSVPQLSQWWDHFKMNSQSSLEKKKEHPRKSIKGEIWRKEERGSFCNTLKRLVLAICNYELFWGAGRAPFPLPFTFSKQEPLLALVLLTFISLSQGPQETKP